MTRSLCGLVDLCLQAQHLAVYSVGHCIQAIAFSARHSRFACSSVRVSSYLHVSIGTCLHLFCRVPFLISICMFWGIYSYGTIQSGPPWYTSSTWYERLWREISAKKQQEVRGSAYTILHGPVEEEEYKYHQRWIFNLKAEHKSDEYLHKETWNVVYLPLQFITKK